MSAAIAITFGSAMSVTSSATTINQSAVTAGTMSTSAFNPAMTPTTTPQFQEGFSHAVSQEFLAYLECNAGTTKTSFTTCKVSDYKNWLIFPNEKPNGMKGKNQLVFSCGIR